jgi:CRP-like cAMP-binding protein
MFPNLRYYLSQKSSLSDKDITYIMSHFLEKKTKRNEILTNYNAVSHQFYFIVKGAVRIYSVNSEGIELSRFFAFENTFCTALPSFIDQKPTYEYLQTIEPCELLVISRKDFYKLVDKYHEFERIYRKVLEFSLINNQQRIYSYQGYTALEKVQLLLKMQPHFLLRVSNKLAASYLGMSPATLSRTKRKL